jgi:uncharacterized ion transporter superfamily protein YfcC
MILQKLKKYLRVPHTFVVIFMITILMALLTWIIPAGEFDRALDPKTGRTVVVAGSYHKVQPSPVGFFELFKSVQLGMIDAAQIIFFVFIVYSSFYIVIKSGAFNGVIGSLIRVTRGKEIWMIPVFMLAFAVGGATFGMFEETYAFIPIFIGLAIALGYDAIVGICMVNLGVAIGFAAAPLNPFTVGIAQTIAELPLFSGMGFRTIGLIIFLLISILYTMNYASKIKRNPSKSLVKDIDFGAFAPRKDDLLKTEFSLRHKAIIAIVGASIVSLVVGVLIFGWYINELAALFLLMGIACGLTAGYSPSKIATVFLEGCASVVFGALIIGLARSILIVAEMGHVADTIIYGLAKPITSMPGGAGAEGMLATQTLINFLIPSGSGQAVTSMPIMTPLADLAGINRQVAVLAYQFGDGFSNMLWPTAGIAVISGIAKVPLDRWWRFYLPLFGMLLLIQLALIGLAFGINLGPF